ncbi:acyl carrier protein [Methylocystis parvus]|uniref:Acyl carrier protein n=1 Tax=Methylocystis parvus TaxID=134 RepID=A0A6B8M9J4_9HYPH|nr:acyl carrier protein [Methylocystis parvus]
MSNVATHWRELVDATTLQTSDRISSIVGQFISLHDDVAPNQDLQELGLTSMQMVNLMLSIEAEFDLTIPSSKLVPSNFRSIENIQALLRDLAH